MEEYIRITNCEFVSEAYFVCNSHEYYTLGRFEDRIPRPLPPCAFCGGEMYLTMNKRWRELSAQPGQGGGDE